MHFFPKYNTYHRIILSYVVNENMSFILRNAFDVIALSCDDISSPDKPRTPVIVPRTLSCEHISSPDKPRTLSVVPTSGVLAKISFYL